MRTRLKIAAVGLGVVGASALAFPVFEGRMNEAKTGPGHAIQQKPDICQGLLSNSREARLSAAWKIAEIPWKKHVAMQVEGAVEPLLKNLQDKDAEVRAVSAMALRSIAENKRLKPLSEGLPLVHDALERETDKAAKDELKLLVSRMRKSQQSPGSFY